MQLSEFTIRKKFAMAAPIFVDTYHIHKGDVQEHASGKTENVSRSPELSQDDAHDESSITGARGEEVVQHCLAERHAGIQQNGEISCRQTKVTISSDQCGYLGETWRRTSPRLTTRSRGWMEDAFQKRNYSPSSCGNSSHRTAKLMLIPVRTLSLNAAPIDKPSMKLWRPSPKMTIHATVAIALSFSLLNSTVLPWLWLGCGFCNHRNKN